MAKYRLVQEGKYFYVRKRKHFLWWSWWGAIWIDGDDMGCWERCWENPQKAEDALNELIREENLPIHKVLKEV